VEWAAANRLAIATRAARALNADFQLVTDAPHNNGRVSKLVEI